ncbi:MAG: hypothetical protein WCF84_04205 [Anaerolineae bacterium]
MNQDTLLPEDDQIPIDLNRLLGDPDPSGTRPHRNVQAHNDRVEQEVMDDWLCAQALQALDRDGPIWIEHEIRNTDRTVGARLAGRLVQRYGERGLGPQVVHIHLRGSAGQSFGAFCVDGLELNLDGEANDYVGKGMAGGQIAIRLPQGARWASQDNYIIGNCVLYGATGGRLFAAGRAGERFAVRNSGAVAVVEGLGDHGCEYMTGGQVVVLGPVGHNFGAGMTGGIAFVLDQEGKLPVRVNPEMVQFAPVAGDADITLLRGLVEQHAAATASAWSRSIMDRWQDRLAQFYKIAPKA